MKLEAGKSYIMANGEVTGPLIECTGWFTSRNFIDDMYISVWKPDGQADFFVSPTDSRNEPFHIVAEHTE